MVITVKCPKCNEYAHQDLKEGLNENIDMFCEECEHEWRLPDSINIISTPVCTGMRKMMEASTCHITEDDTKILAYLCELNMREHPDHTPMGIGNLGYGFAVTVYPGYDIEHTKSELERIGKNLSDSFWKVVKKAVDEGANMLYLDPDAEDHDDLDTYEW